MATIVSKAAAQSEISGNVGMASVQNVRRMKYVQTALSKPTQAM